MAEQEKSERYKNRLKLLAILIMIFIIVAMLAMAIFIKYIFSLLG